MKNDFLLKSELASKLYNEYVKDLPVIDYHNHLNPEEIYTNYKFKDITEAWLAFDHYKWRLMRSNGTSEEMITGNAESFQKFEQFCITMENAIGNPVLLWSQLELKKFFNIDLALSKANAREIFDTVNTMLQDGSHNANFFFENSNVEIVCTTDNPVDDLKFHQLIAKENRPYKVLPTYRPDRFLDFHSEEFADNVCLLEKSVGKTISSYSDYMNALEERLLFFIENGCLLSDHGIESVEYVKTTQEEVEKLFAKYLTEKLSYEESKKLWTFSTVKFLELYKKHGIRVQFHMGPVRNMNSSYFKTLGRDSGFDSIGNNIDIEALGNIFSDGPEILPALVVYNINPTDNYKLATLCNDFITVDGTIKFGAAWWHNDNNSGIIEQMKTLTETGLYGKFLGMLTDSRSILSMSRHDYFRRILCSYLADLYTDGLFFDTEEKLGEMAQNIAYNNVKKFLN